MIVDNLHKLFYLFNSLTAINLSSYYICHWGNIVTGDLKN